MYMRCFRLRGLNKKMNLDNFEREISPVIFERGEGYYQDNAVVDLQRMDNGQYFAIVEGNDDYEINIRLDKSGKVLEYYCNCPYDGEICKHVVATLLEIRDKNQDYETGKNTSKKEMGWKEIINTVPQEKLRKFVENYAAKNRDFRNDLTINFTEYDSTENEGKYKKIVQNAFSLAEGRYGYIEYSDVYGAMLPVHELLSKADIFLGNKIYEEAFAIASITAPECINAIQNLDDSNGECGSAINESFNIISKIYETTNDKNFKEKIFEYILKEADNPDYDSYGCADVLEPLIIDMADTADKILLVHDFINNQLEKAKKLDKSSNEYNIEKYLRFKAGLFDKSGEKEKAERIIYDNIHISNFRETIVNEYIEKENYKEAIKLINEGIKIAIDNNYPGTESQWKKKLLKIYQQQKNIANIRKYALELFFGGSYGMDYYRIFKNTWSTDKWQIERKKIIDKVLKEDNKLRYYGYSFSYRTAEIYVEEKMWKELFTQVKDAPLIKILIEYTKYLKEDYSNDLLAMYRPQIEKYIDKNTGRSTYQQAAAYLKHMSKIKGGKELAKSIVNSMVQRYKNRPAMIDEFKNLEM